MIYVVIEDDTPVTGIKQARSFLRKAMADACVRDRSGIL